MAEAIPDDKYGRDWINRKKLQMSRRISRGVRSLVN